MKKGWQIRPLEELVVQDKGGIKIGPFGSQLKKCDLVSEGIHVLGIENVLSGKFDELGERYISQAKFQTLQSVEVVPGDLLLTMMGTIGKVAVVPPSIRRSIMDSHLLRMRPDQRVIRADYLAWAIRGSTTVLDAIEAQAHGAIMKGLNSAIVRSLPVPVPSLAEQQRIVGELDEAFDGLATATANAEHNLRNARALFESHLQSVFTQRGKGWEEKTLEEIAITFGRGKSKHRPRNAPHLYGGKYPFVQTGDIRNAGHVITEYTQTYSEAGLVQSKLWPKGTICITIAANIAETAILGFDACFPDSVIGVVANPKEADIGFIEYLLQSFKVRIQAMGKGSAQANINMGTFENERFPFPPVSEQKRIVAKLDSLHEETQRLESIYQQKLAALGELKKSLLHQAFNGEL